MPIQSSPQAIGRVAPPVSLLIAFSVLGPVTIQLILPALPNLQRLFGADYATAQLLVSGFVLGFGFGQLAVGPLADRFGKRSMLCAGLMLYTLASLCCALAPGIEALIVLRVMQGLGASAGTVLARAIIREYHEAPASTRILGHLAMGMSLGPILAPTLGGVLFQMAGWRMPFWTLTMLGALTLALAWRMLAPDRQGGDAPPSNLRRDIARLLRDPLFRASWLSVCFNAGTVFTFIACSPLVAQRFLGMTPMAFGLWSVLGALGYIAGNYLAGRLSSRYAAARVMRMGAIGVALGSLALTFALAAGLQSPAFLFGSFAIVMASSGLVMPNAFAGAMAAVPEAAASASGFVGFAQFALGAVFATLAGHLIETHAAPVWLGLVMLVAALAGLIAALRQASQPDL